MITPISSWAVENYQPGSLLFSDDFNSNLTNWHDETGNDGWSINTGNLLGVKTSAHVSGRLTSNAGASWSNYSVEVDVNNNAGVDEGIGFRRFDANNAYELNLRHGTGPYNTPEIKLTKIQNGITTTLKDITTIPLINLKWYRVKIEVLDSHIQVWLDSNFLFELDDPNTTVKAGAASLSFWTGDYGVSIIRFDNLKVTSLSKQFNPVIFIPGIGGSEFQTSQDIIWSQADGHGGTFSHAYPNQEKVWVNQNEAIKLGDDDYFDILRLKTDGQTPEAPLSLNGNLTSFGYADIDSFFQSLGYIKGTNFFIFNYDWRQDLKTTKSNLDNLIEIAKQKTGKSQVDLVSHSMGGLISRFYISDATSSAKVNKLITLGTPFLGTPQALKALLYGEWISYTLPLISLQIGVIPNTETKDIFSNFPAVFELLPNQKYFEFYDNSDWSLSYPFFDGRDIDHNNVSGALDYSQTKTLLTNLGGNAQILSSADQFNNLLFDLNQITGVKFYEIAGVSEPTLGQMIEDYIISWPIQILPYYDEIYINGDSTVPVYSASLRNEKWNLSGNAKIYYTQQKHGELVAQNGEAMNIVKSILQEGDIDPAKLIKASLDGVQVSAQPNVNLDLYDQNGNHTGLKNNSVENKISKVTFHNTKNTKTAFVAKSAPKLTANLTSSQTTPTTTNLKVRTYSNDQITKLSFYQNISLPDNQTIAKLSIDPVSSPSLSINDKVVPPTSEATGSAIFDHNPPKTNITLSGDKDSQGNFIGQVTITLTSSDPDSIGTDTNSGVLSTQYSLDNGQTVLTYKEPFKVTSPGTTTLRVFSTDKVGNQELPQTLTFTVAQITPTSTQSGSISTPQTLAYSNLKPSSSPKATNTQTKTSTSDVLGARFTKTATKAGERLQKISENGESNWLNFRVILVTALAILLGLTPIVAGLILNDSGKERF